MIYSFWLIQACDVYENSLANNIYDKEEYREAMSLLRYDGFKDMFYNILQFLSLEHFLQWLFVKIVIYWDKFLFPYVYCESINFLDHLEKRTVEKQNHSAKLVRISKKSWILWLLLHAVRISLLHVFLFMGRLIWIFPINRVCSRDELLPLLQKCVVVLGNALEGTDPKMWVQSLHFMLDVLF